jgi:hypothetical protein
MPTTTTADSRDLSEVFGKALMIEIQGVGKRKEEQWLRCTLANRVAVALFRMTGASTFNWIKNSHEAPWKVVSFDRDGCKLVVINVS